MSETYRELIAQLTNRAAQQKLTDIEDGILCADGHITELQAENKALKEFARYVIRTECWCQYEQDGCELQDLAEKLGLIVSSIVTADEVDDFEDFIVGDEIYKFSDILKEQ